jgi:DNA gyrase subunit B
VPGLGLTITDERTPEPQVHQFKFDGGLVEFADYLAKDSALTSTWRLSGTGAFTETIPVLNEAGNMESREVDRNCEVEVALRWGVGYDTEVKSFVNIIATPKGGTHLAGFEQAVLKVLRAQIDANSRKLKLGNDKVEKEDAFAGLTAVVSVRLAEPQFEGQTKEILGTPAVKNIVANVITKALTERLTSAKRDDKAQSALLLQKVVAEMKSSRPALTRKLKDARMRSNLRRCRQSWSIVEPKKPRFQSSSSLRETRRSVPQNWLETASIRLFFRFAEKSLTYKRPLSATCFQTPNALRLFR